MISRLSASKSSWATRPQLGSGSRSLPQAWQFTTRPTKTASCGCSPKTGTIASEPSALFCTSTSTCLDSIDEKIQASLEWKRSLASYVVDGVFEADVSTRDEI
ncbi:hypothetical protein WP1_191 [Pseudomonas phage WP1]